MNNQGYSQSYGMDPAVSIPAPLNVPGQVPMAYPLGVYPGSMIITGGNDGPL